ncbi:uncharacterized protein CXQ87_004011 [Candidozyma duobushaemuli]|uniref:Uncharacterized protein n=2 Tax=Candidozyma TaxID=3303203 RepID=A0ABX8IBA1_9ASCO|nr:uncharacterized protein CXQ87_004011 [[Candida] duobushaemulonis]PVH16146.1 hypothetical protein CXQ87_004011 [[Candida] duobushaemulonis]QWU89180.1 hypothetical protein CA3LBN_003503 [[Candida] haemuloni]
MPENTASTTASTTMTSANGNKISRNPLGKSIKYLIRRKTTKKKAEQNDNKTILPDKTKESKPISIEEVFDSPEEKKKALRKEELKRCSTLRRSFEICKDSLKSNSIFSINHGDTNSQSTKPEEHGSGSEETKNVEVKSEDFLSAPKRAKDTTKDSLQMKRKPTKRARFLSTFHLRPKLSEEDDDTKRTLSAPENCEKNAAKQGTSKLCKTSTTRTAKPPSFDNLKELSRALKKIGAQTDNDILYENGEAVLYHLDNSLEEEVVHLIDSSKTCPDSNAKVEEILDQFSILFGYLSTEVNAPLRRRIAEIGNEMRRFADLLEKTSAKVNKSHSRESKKEACDKALSAFKKISIMWADEGTDITEALAKCQILYQQTTRAYTAFYNWHCSLYIKPHEAELFHTYYGITHYRKSCHLLLKRDFYTLIQNSLEDLRKGLDYLFNQEG